MPKQKQNSELLHFVTDSELSCLGFLTLVVLCVCVCVLENSEQHAGKQTESLGVRDARGTSRVPFYLVRSSNQTSSY